MNVSNFCHPLGVTVDILTGGGGGGATSQNVLLLSEKIFRKRFTCSGKNQEENIVSFPEFLSKSINF